MTVSKCLSIILPSYNDIRIGAAIQSIQYFDDNNSVKIIVVDGGSNESTKQIIQSYLSADDIFISEPDNLLRHHRYPIMEPRPVGPVVVPINLVPVLLKEHHEHPLFGGHEGPQRMLNRLRRYYFWPGMNGHINKRMASTGKEYG